MLKVYDFYDKLDKIAPFKTAFGFDNVGLLIGDMNGCVRKVLLSLDVTEKIVELAIQKKIDLIISHHPVIFQAQKNIVQKKILNIIENKIAIISAHKNLDVSKHGVNYVLAETLGLQNIQTLSMSYEINQYQICVYTPFESIEKLVNAMNKAGAGVIGNYIQCATYFETMGQYMPLQNSNPYYGHHDHLVKVNEMKLELLCEEACLQKVLNAMFQNHPYETPVYTVIPLKQSSPNFGLGCYGDLTNSMSIKDFSVFVKDRLHAPFVKLWLADKNIDLHIKNVAVCGGSGSSLISAARQKAEVFVSADFTYHQLLDAAMPIIDAGHFYTENPMMEKLKNIFQDFDCDLSVIEHSEHDISSMRWV